MLMLTQAIATAPAASRAALEQLCALYGVTCLERDAAFFLAAGCITGADLALVKAEQRALCSSLVAGGKACAALALCEGFGIPDHCLQAPIAFDWKKI